MIRCAVHWAAALTIVAGTLFFTSVLRADDAILGASAPSAPVVAEPVPAADTVRLHTESTGPDMREMSGGIVTFGISYGVALGVAATSGHQGDSHLYVPIVGPWLDFGDRGSCSQASCNREMTYRVLIVADGILQALGALSIVSAFVFQTTHEITTATATDAMAPTLKITPVEYAHGGLGLAASGTF
jgi:hypothetical protein